MRVYAVVGGIAAGKSTVARRLARRHRGVRIDADRLGHRVLRLAPVRRRLLEVFGPDIVARGGEIDRRRLGALVFGRPGRLARLGAIVHPEIASVLRARLAAEVRRGTRFVLLDAALFYDFELGRPVDAVVAVVAPVRVRRERLRRRSRLSEVEIDARLRSQTRLASWVRRADVVLDSDCSLAELDARIDRVWRTLLRLRRRTRAGRKTGRGAHRGSRDAATARLASEGVPLMWPGSAPRQRGSSGARPRRASGTTRRRRGRRWRS